MDRGLKHRPPGEKGTAPAPPEPVAILKHHIKENGLVEMEERDA